MGVGIFLDRDGTINEEVDYLTSPDQLKLIKGSAAAIRELNKAGKVFIITNQSGIARGLLTEARLKEIHDRLESELKKENAVIDAIYYCPHHPDYGGPQYQKNCDCRKPKTGMIDQAVAEHNIDIKKSYVIGDRMLDMQTANNAGAQSILVLTGYGKIELELCKQNNVHIDHIAQNLSEAARRITQGIAA